MVGVQEFRCLVMKKVIERLLYSPSTVSQFSRLESECFVTLLSNLCYDAGDIQAVGNEGHEG